MPNLIAIGLLAAALSLSIHAAGEPPIIVADWTFEEGNPGATISTVEDHSGNGHSLTTFANLPSAQFIATDPTREGLVSALVNRVGDLGSAFRTETNSSLNLGNEFTIEFSVKRNPIPADQIPSFQIMLMIASSQRAILGINSEPGGVSIHAFGSEGVGQLFVPESFTDKSQHIAFVAKDRVVSVYVDGVLQDSGSLPELGGNQEAARVFLGAGDTGYWGFDGTMDRVRISRKALTPQGFFPHRRTSGLIIEPLASQTVEAGGRAVLRVVADSSAGPLTYEWMFNGTFDESSTATPIAGANSDTLILDPVDRLQDGVYSVRVSNGQGQSATSSALLPVGRTLPIIQTGPKSQAVSVGASVQFTVEAYNDRSISFAWLFNGVEIPGENSPTLVLPSAQASHAGKYAALIRTPTWTLVSPDAVLTVAGTDTVPPVISLTSPVSGVVDSNRVTIAGTFTDDIALGIATLEHNGQVVQNFSYEHFYFPNFSLNQGTNILRIRATDHAGNGTTNEVVLVYNPERFLSVPVEATAQEGGYLTVPIMFQSNGEVGGIEFYINYWSNRLSAPKITWLVEKDGARGELVPEFGRFRASFTLPPGQTIPAGNIPLAQIRFKTLSLPEPFTAHFVPAIIGIRSSTGELFPTGNGAFGGGLTITLREITADNNANDRLDVGDASAIQRRLAGLDTLQPYDITGNDLNGDSALDAEDALRVLRTVVEIDSQPQAPVAAARSAKSLSASAAAGSSVRLAADAPEIRPGQKVKVSVLLGGNDSPLEGASFKLEYPVSALRLDDAQSHHVGAIVPPTASTLWNLAPSQNNYETQNGVIYLAACSAAHWAETNGTLAEFTFTVQSGSTSQQSWPIRISRVELSHDSDLQTFSGNEIVLVTAPDLPVIATQPASQTVRTGGPVQFSVTATSTAPLTYSWLFNGVEIQGENSSTLSLPLVQLSHAGTYNAVVRNSAGATVSLAATLTVLVPDIEPPVITIISPSERITSIGRITLAGSISDAGGISSATLDHGGLFVRDLPEGQFSIPDLALTLGTNIFTIRAADHVGNTSVVEVIVVFEREGPSARLSIGGYNPGEGTFEMGITGEAGFRYRIDQSEDLNTWTEMQTIIATPGESVISDGGAGGRTHRYYRAVPIK